jgi:hypothetical protein
LLPAVRTTDIRLTQYPIVARRMNAVADIPLRMRQLSEIITNVGRVVAYIFARGSRGYPESTLFIPTGCALTFTAQTT